MAYFQIFRSLSRLSMAYLQSLYDEFKVNLNRLLVGEESIGQQTGSLPNKDLVYAPLFDIQASACILIETKAPTCFLYSLLPNGLADEAMYKKPLNCLKKISIWDVARLKSYKVCIG